MIKKIEQVDEVCVRFTDEELKKMGWEVGTKLSINVLDNGTIEIKPFAKMEIELSELPREILEQLIVTSCEQDKSINEVVSDILKAFIKDYADKQSEHYESNDVT